jgi:glycosyltransferase involved in cell wall biosynthesis
VAYFYEQPDNSTFRYRVYNMIQALTCAGLDISAAFFCLDDLPWTQEIADSADRLVICRTRYDHRVGQLINAFRSRRKPVLFDIDDLVFDTRYVDLILDTLDQDCQHPEAWDFWYACIGRLGGTLRLCDGAITTTPPLAEAIRRFASVPVAVAPNFLNHEQLAISEQVYAEKKASGFQREGPVHLGYFSGTPTHRKDFGLIAPALATLLAERPDVHLSLVGHLEVPQALVRHKARIHVHPFQDFVNLQRLIASVELNLVPLQTNVFTNAKSDLKYVDAAVVGTQTIATPTIPYRNALRQGETGYLASAHQWVAVMRHAINALEQYAPRAGRARDDVLARYTPEAQVPAILGALGYCQ